MTIPAWLTTALAIIPVVQHVASGLSAIPSLWGHNQTTGPGSGWYKFWNAVASYPGFSDAGSTASIQAPTKPGMS